MSNGMVPVTDENGKVYDSHLPPRLSEAQFEIADLVGLFNTELNKK